MRDQITYTVRPVTRYVIVRHHVQNGRNLGTVERGEFHCGRIAEEVAQTLCAGEAEYHSDSALVQYAGVRA